MPKSSKRKVVFAVPVIVSPFIVAVVSKVMGFVTPWIVICPTSLNVICCPFCNGPVQS